MADYPRIGRIHRRSVSHKDGEVGCIDCKNKIPAGTAMCLVDIQYNWFRGDDDVAVLCMSCSEVHIDVRSLIKKLHD